ncbi:hypothetical protein JL_215 [Bacillus phage JL]|uniref:Uncharacterized protein n=1 Tax=Bacillus phage JL TaxID=1296655 RepID=S5MAS9_9CAUD|nr:hypothetical protein AVV47_gp081 [Bacillus phage JL]AGR46879.1 hypothetical protein JL_215 [Bacillus phage JL]
MSSVSFPLLQNFLMKFPIILLLGTSPESVCLSENFPIRFDNDFSCLKLYPNFIYFFIVGNIRRCMMEGQKKVVEAIVDGLRVVGVLVASENGKYVIQLEDGSKVVSDNIKEVE